MISPNLKRTDSLPANLLATALCVLAWGYFRIRAWSTRWAGLTPCGRCSVSPTRCWRAWPDALRGSAVQDEAPALRMGGAGANGVAADLYLTAGWQKAFSPDNKVGFRRSPTSSGDDRQR